MLDLESLLADLPEVEIEFGTEGQCASFALALHDLLDELGLPCELVAIAPTRDPKDWNHVLVRTPDGRMWDVRGAVGPRDIRYFGSETLAFSRTQVETEIRRCIEEGASLYDEADRYGHWREMLAERRMALPGGPRPTR